MDLDLKPFKDRFFVSKFTFKNIHGGTGMSDGMFGEGWKEPVEVKPIRVWDDYETGIRFWVKPINPNVALLEYLERNVKKGRTIIGDVDGWEETDEYVLYVSEFDIVEQPLIKDINELVVFIPVEGDLNNFVTDNFYNGDFIRVDDGIVVAKRNEKLHRELVKKFESKQTMNK